MASPEQPAATVLVTGDKIVSAVDVAFIESAGFKVQRLAHPDGTLDQLIRALQGKLGYICAGHEKVTDAVLTASPDLEVISFPGSGYTEFIPAWELATTRGVAICAAIGANAPSVADYTIKLMLAMLRLLPCEILGSELGPWPARELRALNLGIIGMGNSGRLVARLAHNLGMTVRAAVRRSSANVPRYVGLASLDDLVSSSDVITVHVDRIHGRSLLGADQFARMRDGALLVNVAFPDAVDWNALREALVGRRLRAVFDAPPIGDYSDLPPYIFLASRSQRAYDTIDANQRLGRLASEALVSVLRKAAHPRVVNPDFIHHRGSKKGRHP